MKWLLGPVIAAAGVAFVVTRVYDYAVDTAKDGAAGVVRAGLWHGVWTAVFTATGMRGLTNWVKGLRQSNKGRR